MVDTDGSIEYTEIKHVNFTSSQDFSVSYYPNPTRDLVKVSSTVELENHELVISDMLGREIQRLDFTDEAEVKLDKYSPGIYTFILSDQYNNVKSRKMVVKQ